MSDVFRFGIAPFMIILMFFTARSEGKRRSKLMRFSVDQCPAVEPTQFAMWRTRAINATKIARWGSWLPLCFTLAGFVAAYEPKVVRSAGNVILAGWLVSWVVWFCLITVSTVVNRKVTRAAQAAGIAPPK